MTLDSSEEDTKKTSNLINRVCMVAVSNAAHANTAIQEPEPSWSFMKETDRYHMVNQHANSDLSPSSSEATNATEGFLCS
jgi:hypothetical protein